MFHDPSWSFHGKMVGPAVWIAAIWLITRNLLKTWLHPWLNSRWSLKQTWGCCQMPPVGSNRMQRGLLGLFFCWSCRKWQSTNYWLAKFIKLCNVILHGDCVYMHKDLLHTDAHILHTHTIYALVDFDSAIYTIHANAVGPRITATALTPHRCSNFLVPWCLISPPCWMTWRKPLGFGVASLGTKLDLQAKQSALRWRMLKGITCLCNTGFTGYSFFWFWSWSPNEGFYVGLTCWIILGRHAPVSLRRRLVWSCYRSWVKYASRQNGDPF